MNTVYMVFVGLGDILDPMFLLITVACLWIKKKRKAKKSCRLVHMAEIDLHFQQSKSHVHEYFRPNLPQCWLKYPYRPILLV